MDNVWYGLSDGNYIFKEKNGQIAIPYSKIIYFQSFLHQIEIVTTEGTHKHKMVMKKLAEFIPGQFVQCHRTIIVNVNHILSMHPREIKVSGNVMLPVSSSCAEILKKAYLKKIRI